MTVTRASSPASRKAKPTNSNGEAPAVPAAPATPAAPTTDTPQAPPPLPPFVTAALDRLSPNAGKVLRTAWQMAAEQGGDPTKAGVFLADVGRRLGKSSRDLGTYKNRIIHLDPALWPWPRGATGRKPGPNRRGRETAISSSPSPRPSWAAEPAAQIAVGEIVMRLPTAMAERVLNWAMERVREGGQP